MSETMDLRLRGSKKYPIMSKHLHLRMRNSVCGEYTLFGWDIITTSSVGIRLLLTPNAWLLNGMNTGTTSMRILLSPAPKYSGKDLLQSCHGVGVVVGRVDGCGRCLKFKPYGNFPYEQKMLKRYDKGFRGLGSSYDRPVLGLMSKVQDERHCSVPGAQRTNIGRWTSARGKEEFRVVE